MNKPMRFAAVTLLAISLSFVLTTLARRIYSQTSLAPRVSRHTINRITTYVSGSEPQVQVIEYRHYQDGSLFQRIMPDGDEGTLVVNNASTRLGFDVDFKTKQFHRWMVRDGNPFVTPLSKTCKDNVKLGANNAVATDTVNVPKLGHATEKITSIMTVNGKLFTTVRYAAPDIECQEMLKETYVDNALTSREEVMSVEVGAQDLSLLELPVWAQEVDSVQWLTSYVAARNLPPPHFPEGHPMAKYFQ
jgi:hypothetical protein